MHIRIKTDRIGTRFLGVLILALCMAMPAPTAAGNKHTGTVLRTPKAKAKTIIIAPPKTSVHADLKPNDPPATVVNKWYCSDGDSDSHGLDFLRKDIEGIYENIKIYGNIPEFASGPSLLGLANNFLESKDENPTHFFTAATNAKYNFFTDTWNANPAQGQTVSKTWKNCYSKPELEAYKREAIRWAKYILNVYLPKNFPNLK